MISRILGQYMSLSLNAKGFLVFILIVVFEGALRKWGGFPTSLLMVARDGIALLIIIRTALYGRYSEMPNVFRFVLIWSVILVFYSLFQAMINQTPPVLLLIGWRFWLLYLWFALAIACSLNRDELHFIARTIMVIAIIMLPLVFLQSVLPPSHILNTQPDTDISNIFRLSGDIVRVAGTFSFTLGFTCFVALLIPLAFSGKLINRELFSNKFVYSTALFSVFMMSLFSGSRAALLWCGGMYALFTISEFMVNRSHAALKRIVYMFFGGVFLSLILITFFEANIDAYTSRFEVASDSENFFNRVLVIFFGEPHVMNDMNFWGHGLGVGSNAGGAFLSGGERVFFLAESEPGRNLLEGGFLGVLWILIKYLLGVYSCLWGLLLLKKTGDTFPFLTAITCFYAFAAWPVSGQLSANAIAYILLAFFLCSVRESKFQIRVVA